MKRAYCTSTGSLKPRRWRYSLTSLAWMSIGMKSSTGSPDRRTIPNTAVSERTTTSTVWSSREAIQPRISAALVAAAQPHGLPALPITEIEQLDEEREGHRDVD